MQIPTWAKILIMVSICLVTGYLSGVVTRDAIATWYVHLNKPVFNPPNWIFPPVWTTLYILMGIAAGMIWSEANRVKVKTALWIFAGQLVLNSLWSILFFGLGNPGMALVEVVVLLAMIIWTIRAFWPIKKVAAYLLFPYVAWVSFATVLNAAIWWLN